MIHAYMHTGMHAYMKLKHIEQTSKDSNRKNILICFALDGKLCLSNSLFIFFASNGKFCLSSSLFFASDGTCCLSSSPHVPHQLLFTAHVQTPHPSHAHTHIRTHKRTQIRAGVPRGGQRYADVRRGTQRYEGVRGGTQRYADVRRGTPEGIRRKP